MRSADEKTALTNYYLTVLTPIADDGDSRLQHLQQLEERLEMLRREPSPFAACESVHMARFVVIDELPLQLGDTRREFLSRNYLLFIAELSGEPNDFLDEIYHHDALFVESIWGHCFGFPRLAETLDGEEGRPRAQYRSVCFRRYMRRHEIKTLIPFAGVPNVSVREIKDAIATQERVTAFIAKHPPHTPAAVLHAAWKREFEWP
jgi:hypothetical protein